MEVTLTGAEALFIAYTLGVNDSWPPNDDEAAGGPRLRLMFLWHAREILEFPEMSSERARCLKAALSPFVFSDAELWLLDSLIGDPRGKKLPDGNPVEPLALKVWSALLESDVLEGVTFNANDHEDKRAHAHVAHGAAVDGPGDGARA